MILMIEVEIRRSFERLLALFIKLNTLLHCNTGMEPKGMYGHIQNDMRMFTHRSVSSLLPRLESSLKIQHTQIDN